MCQVCDASRTISAPSASKSALAAPAASYTRPRTGVSTRCSISERSREPCRSGESSAPPMSQHTTVTPANAGTSVPSRSGSATTPSMRDLPRSASRVEARVVPRTACPETASAAASEVPRQPQPTIRTRATSLVRGRGSARCARGSVRRRRSRPRGWTGPRRRVRGAGAAAQLLAPALVRRHLGADVVLADLDAPARPATCVLRLDHLIHVVDLELRLHLRRARGAPVHLLRPRAGIPLPDRQEDPDHHQPSEEDEQGELVHARRVYAPARCEMQ